MGNGEHFGGTYKDPHITAMIDQGLAEAKAKADLVAEVHKLRIALADMTKERDELKARAAVREEHLLSCREQNGNLMKARDEAERLFMLFCRHSAIGNAGSLNLPSFGGSSPSGGAGNEKAND